MRITEILLEDVELDKPFRTPKGPKKFSVYVKNDKGNVVKVNFGDPDMEIKRDDDKRRKSFRARHKCDQKKDKTKPSYWSCKFWEKDRSVSDLLKEELLLESKLDQRKELVDRIIAAIIKKYLPRVKKAKLKIEFITTTDANATHAFSTKSGVHLIQVGKRSPKGRDLIGTVAHELMHVDQTLRGDLEAFGQQNYIWKGKTYPQTTPYRAREHEQEAKAFGDKVERDMEINRASALLKTSSKGIKYYDLDGFIWNA